MRARLADAARGIVVEAVVFDMDGLMFDTERVAVEAWSEAAREMGLGVPRDVFLGLVGLASAGMRPALTARYGDDFPYEELRRRRLAIAAARLETGVPVKRGLVALLEHLEARGIPRGVATSTNRARVLPLLESTDLARRFQVVTCGDDVANCKPDPEIFLASATALGVPPCRCLVLEDSPIGIAAARAAGAIPVMVPDLLPPPPDLAGTGVRVMPDLVSVRTWLGNFEHTFQDMPGRIGEARDVVRGGDA